MEKLRNASQEGIKSCILTRVARWHIFFKPKNLSLGKFWRVLKVEDVGIFYWHLVYFTAIWYILWPFGIFYCYLVYLSRFGMLREDKSGNPDLAHMKKLFGAQKVMKENDSRGRFDTFLQSLWKENNNVQQNSAVSKMNSGHVCQTDLQTCKAAASMPVYVHECQKLLKCKKLLSRKASSDRHFQP
jgi:hypothetical protein